jgi:hypothetical protein
MIGGLRQEAVRRASLDGAAAIAYTTGLSRGRRVLAPYSGPPWDKDWDEDVFGEAEKVRLTGNKAQGDIFYWYTGYPGGIKGRSKGEILAGKHPERVILKAVERMLPRGPLGRQVLKNLRVFAGPDHPHAGQQPTPLDVAAMNRKNVRA